MSTLFCVHPQLFGVMNEILMEDSACSQRRLVLRTYQVIPMTPKYVYCATAISSPLEQLPLFTYTLRVGLIEWVENTKPLKEFLQDALTDTERKHYRY